MLESEQLEIRRAELEGEVKWIRELTESTAYKNLLRHLQVRLFTLRAQLMTSEFGNAEAAFAAARLRGQITELETCMILPELMVRGFEDDLSRIYEEQRLLAEGDKE